MTTLPTPFGSLRLQEDMVSKLSSELVSVPRTTPECKPWHVERAGVIDATCERIQCVDGPRVVGLIGCSGSGKTTVASQVVRRTEVRALFSDGIVWLPVGASGKARLRSLMFQLSETVHEVVMGSEGRAPTASEDHAAYIKRLMEGGHDGQGLRCLVVADHVCDEEVIAALKNTGMWVLATARNLERAIAADDDVVTVGMLCLEEAKAVLLGASQYPSGEPLPAAACQLVELCGHVAMDLEFVGRLSSLCCSQNGDSWSEAAAQIHQEMENLEYEHNEIGHGSVDAVERRTAVFRAGCHLGVGNALDHELFLALAVMPDDYMFSAEDALIMLYDGPCTTENRKAVEAAVESLERWGVLAWAQGGRARMHTAHVRFAIESLMNREDLRQGVASRWANYLSLLTTVRSKHIFDLVRLWQAIERVGSDGWRVLRPYEKALAEMDVSDASYLPSVEAVAMFYELEGDEKGGVRVMRRVLELNAANPGMDALHVAHALRVCIDAGGCQGDKEEEQKLRLELQRILNDPAVERLRVTESDSDPSGTVELPSLSSLFILAACLDTAGRSEDAESLCRRALSCDEATKLGAEHPLVVLSTWLLGYLLVEAKRPADAVKYLREALEVEEAKLGANHISVGLTAYKLARCAQETGQLGEAEMFYRRALDIEVAILGPNALQVAGTLYVLGQCIRDDGRPVEAEDLFRRAMEIEESKLGPDDVQVAFTLQELGRCVQDAGRPGEAEELIRRALLIRVAKLGPDDVQVAYTLHALGVCVRRDGRPMAGEELLRRAWSILEAELGPDDAQVAVTLHALGQCVRATGRPAEAEVLFRRVLKIDEATLSPADIHVAFALHDLGLCIWEAGRPQEAEEYFRRALAIKEAESTPNDEQVAITLLELGRCIRATGRASEAESLFRRVLSIDEATVGSNELQASFTLYELGRCAREAGRPEEGESLVRRALAIKEAKLGPDDRDVAVALHELSRCVSDAGRPGEANALFLRALHIQQRARSGHRVEEQPSAPEE